MICVSARGHDARYLYTHLLHLLRHNSPALLKQLDPPHTLETLVPEAVLTQYIARRERYSSLSGFKIASAVEGAWGHAVREGCRWAVEGEKSGQVRGYMELYLSFTGELFAVIPRWRREEMKGEG